MFGLGAGELLLIGVIALIFIGPKKLPELAQGLGRALREFQKAKDDFQASVAKEVRSEDLQKITSALQTPYPNIRKEPAAASPAPVTPEKKPEV